MPLHEHVEERELRGLVRGLEVGTVVDGRERDEVDFARRQAPQTPHELLASAHGGGQSVHVVQDMEVFEVDGRRVPCYYSLGNAVSNMSATNTRIELMLHLKIARTRGGDIVLLPP